MGEKAKQNPSWIDFGLTIMIWSCWNWWVKRKTSIWPAVLNKHGQLTIPDSW